MGRNKGRYSEKLKTPEKTREIRNVAQNVIAI